MKLFFSKIFFFFSVCSATAYSGTLESSGWLALGELRGYFEPCGCDPEADLGGVIRQYGFLARERALQPKLLLFNLGNNLPIEEAESYKIPSLVHALSRMQNSAVLVNELEFLALKKPNDLGAKLPMVISNFRQTPPAGVSSVIHQQSVAIAGFMYRDKFRSDLADANEDFLKKILALTKQSTQRVLLFSGTSKQLKFFIDAKAFDLIVSANDTPLSRVVGPDEREDESKLNRGLTGIRMVPVGGQGVLRGGVLASSKAPLLKDLLGSSVPDCKESKSAVSGCSSSPEIFGKKVDAGANFTWLDKSYAGLTTKLDDLVKQYVKAGEDRYGAIANQRKSELATSNYVGAKACQGCHAEAYKIWETSGHAHAFATLEKNKRAKDPFCVSCHVVGYSEKGGFVTKELSPHLTDVQCETCHGARKEHVESPKVKAIELISSKDLCVTCHQGTHSSNFDFKAYWEKIKHSSK